MHKRTLLYLILALVMLGALVTPIGAQEGEKLRIAFMHVGPITDMGWTYAHDQARLCLEENLDYIEKPISYVENILETADAERVLSDFARKGFDIIFATADGYNPAVATVASEFPDVYFFVIEGPYEPAAPNIEGYFGRMYQPRYLSGLVAGKMTKSNKIGYVAAHPIPQVIKGINGFTLGVRAVNSEATVHVVWTNTWYDPVREREAAEALLDEGCDVIAQHQDSTEPQKAAEERGMYGIGYDVDMSPFAPEATLTGPVWDWCKYYLPRVEAIHNGTWSSSRFFGGMETGVVGLAPMSDKVPQDVQDLAEETKQLILDGHWDVFTGPIYNQDGELVVPECHRLNDFEINSMRWFVEGVVGTIE